MSVGSDLFAGSVAVGGVICVIIAIRLLKWSAMSLWRFIEHLFLPLESRLLRFLQERAMARALGVDIEVIRARRRIETGH